MKPRPTSAAHGLFTFRTITLPTLSTAIVSGALLAFGLSFDEVIVTTFTAGAQNTLPLWIFGAIRLGQQLPEVNVVVGFVLLLTVIPVGIAARLTGGGGVTRASAAGTSPPRARRRRRCSPVGRARAGRPLAPLAQAAHANRSRAHGNAARAPNAATVEDMLDLDHPPALLEPPTLAAPPAPGLLRRVLRELL